MGERVKVDAKKPEVKRDNVNVRMREGENSRSMDTSVDHILYLQRTAGNQAVQRLIKSGALQAKFIIDNRKKESEQETDRVSGEELTNVKSLDEMILSTQNQKGKEDGSESIFDHKSKSPSSVIRTKESIEVSPKSVSLEVPKKNIVYNKAINDAAEITFFSENSQLRTVENIVSKVHGKTKSPDNRQMKEFVRGADNLGLSLEISSIHPKVVGIKPEQSSRPQIGLDPTDSIVVDEFAREEVSEKKTSLSTVIKEPSRKETTIAMEDFSKKIIIEGEKELAPDIKTAVEEMSSAFSSAGEVQSKKGKSKEEKLSEKETGNPELEQWKSRITRSTKRIDEPDVSGVKESPKRFAEKGQTLNSQRRKSQPNYLAKGWKRIEPTSQLDSPLPSPEPDPVPGATNLIENAINRRLLDQSLPPVTRSPGHPRLDGSRGQLPTLQPRIPRDDIKRPELIPPEVGEIVEPNPNAEKLKEKLAKKPKETITETGGKPVTIRDEGPPPEKSVSVDLKIKIEEALASLIAKKNETAMAFVITAVDSAYPNKELQKQAPNIVNDMVGPEEQKISEKLHRVASEAGIAKNSLQNKVTKFKENIEKTQESSANNLELRRKEVREKTIARGEDEQNSISKATGIIKLEIEHKQEAASGNVDNKVIESKRDRIIKKLNTEVSRGKAAFGRVGESRNRKLGRAGSIQALAYRKTSKAEANAIRALFEDEIKGRLQAKPSLDWGYKGSKKTEYDVSILKIQASDAVKKIDELLDSDARTAREMVRNWAAEKMGEERNWWKRFVDTIRDWVSQATADKEVWEQAEAQLSRDNLIADFEKLEEIRKVIASGNKEKLEASMAGLSAEERVVVNTFFGTGGNTVQAVATGMLLRMQQRRVPRLVEVALERSLQLEDYKKLDNLGRAQNKSFHAAEIARQVYDAVAGWGTNEAQIYRALNRRTPIQVAAIKKIYKVYYKSDIESDLKSDLSGEEEKRALRQLEGDVIGADVAALREAVEGWGTDEATIMKVLRNKTPAEREELFRRYKEEHKVDLKKEIESELSGLEKKRAHALLKGEVAKADAIAIEDTMGGFFGPDREAAEAVYTDIRQEVESEAASRKMTTAEMEAEIRSRNSKVETAYEKEFASNRKGALREAFNVKFSGAELDLMKGLHDYDTTAIDVARLRIETSALFVTDDDTVNSILRAQHERARTSEERDLGIRLHELDGRAKRENWPAKKLVEKKNELREKSLKDIERRGKENMKRLESIYDLKYSTFGSGRLRLDLAFTTSGYDQDLAFDLLAQGGKLSPAQEIHYAIAGAGTKEEALKQALKGKSKDEIEIIKKEYKKKYNSDMVEDIMSDVSGRDEFDMKVTLEGKPETPAEMMALLKKRKEWELTEGRGWFGIASTEEHALEVSYKDAKEAYEKYEAAKIKYKSEDHPEVRKLKAQFERFGGYVEGNIEQYRKGVDRIADYAATAAELTVVVAGVVLGAFFTGGTASAATLAAYAAVTAGVSAAAGITTRAAIKGEAYGWEDLATDAAIGGVDVAATALTFGISKALIQTGKLARLAKGSVGRRMMAHFLAEGVEGATGGLPTALVTSLLSDQTWEGGNPFQAILLGTAMGTGMGLGLGGGLGSFGGIKAPEIKPPGVKTPEIKPPRVKTPEVKPPEVKPPEVKPPEVKPPEVKPPEVKPPEVKPPEVKPPEVKPPEVGLPKSFLPGVDPKLTAALPHDLQGRVPIRMDSKLPSNTVRVHYDVDADGLVRNIHIRIGPTASQVDIQLHVKTVRLMQRYTGVAGKVRNLLRRIRAFISRNGEPPVGSRAWEAKLEVEKLDRIIKERAGWLAKGDLDSRTRAKLHDDITNLEDQLAKHQETIDEMDLTSGRGFVAAEGKPEKIKDILTEDGIRFKDPELQAHYELFLKSHPDVSPQGWVRTILPGRFAPEIPPIPGLNAKQKSRLEAILQDLHSESIDLEDIGIPRGVDGLPEFFAACRNADDAFEDIKMRAGKIFNWLETKGIKPEPGTLFWKPSGGRLVDIPRIVSEIKTSHGVGVEGGRLAAQKEGIDILKWDNPRQYIGDYGKGIDDLGSTQDGNIFILEWKGGPGSTLSPKYPAQMSPEWVGAKIAELEYLNCPMAKTLLDRAKNGMLHGRVYKTTIEEGHLVTGLVDIHTHGKKPTYSYNIIYKEYKKVLNELKIKKPIK